jgi:hypothetical protein
MKGMQIEKRKPVTLLFDSYGKALAWAQRREAASAPN